MAQKKGEISIVSVFAWFSNVVDTQELKLADIGLLMHLIKNLNRNFWKPQKMSVYKIAKNSGSDDRTIRGALKRLAEKNILMKRNGAKIDRIDNPAEFFASKKFKQSDNTNYFSINQRNGEFFIGIETEEQYFARTKSADQEPVTTPAETAQNAAGDTERPAKVKTLANFL